MSIIIQLQNLPWSATSADIRNFFCGLKIPKGGVHIVGGEKGCAFIAFVDEEDAIRAMKRDGGIIVGKSIKLLSSSLKEMKSAIEQFHEGISDDELFFQKDNSFEGIENKYKLPNNEVSRSETNTNSHGNHCKLIRNVKKIQSVWNTSTKEPVETSNGYKSNCYSEECVLNFPGLTQKKNLPSYIPSFISSKEGIQHSSSRVENNLQAEAESFIISLKKANEKDFNVGENLLTTENKYLQACAPPPPPPPPSVTSFYRGPEGVSEYIGKFQSIDFQTNVSPIAGKRSINICETSVSTQHYLNDHNRSGENVAYFREYEVRDSVSAYTANEAKMKHFLNSDTFNGKISTADQGVFSDSNNLQMSSNSIPLYNEKFDNLQHQKVNYFYQTQGSNPIIQPNETIEVDGKTDNQYGNHIWPENLNVHEQEDFLDDNQVQISSYFYVQITGLDSNADSKDVQCLLRECFVPYHFIKFGPTEGREGMKSAYVKLSSKDDLYNALQNGKTYFNDRYVEISKCSDSLFNSLSPVDTFPYVGNVLNSCLPKNKELFVMLKGLPYSASENDVHIFFKGLNIVKVFVEYDDNGRASGVGFVEFASFEDFNLALKMNGFKIGHRYIEIFESTRDQLNKVKMPSDINCEQKVDTEFLHGVGNDQYSMNSLGKRSSPMSLNVECKGRVIGTVKHPLCVLLAGLPKFVKNKQIRNFCSESGIIPHAIHILLNDYKQPCGRAFVEFLDPFDLDAILKRRNPTIGGQVITVKQMLYEEMLNILKNCVSRHNFVEKKVRRADFQEQMPKKVPYLWIPPDDDDHDDDNDNMSVNSSTENMFAKLKTGQFSNTLDDNLKNMPWKDHGDGKNESLMSGNLNVKAMDGGKGTDEKLCNEKSKKFSSHVKHKRDCCKHKNNRNLRVTDSKEKYEFKKLHKISKEKHVKDLTGAIHSRKSEESTKPKKAELVGKVASTKDIQFYEKSKGGIKRSSLKESRIKNYITQHTDGKRNYPISHKDYHFKSSSNEHFSNRYSRTFSAVDQYHLSSAEDFRNSRRCIVEASNIDSEIGLDELLDFFRGYDLCGDDIIRKYTHHGKPLGDIRVAFHCFQDAQRAIRFLNHQCLRGKIVTLCVV